MQYSSRKIFYFSCSLFFILILSGCAAGAIVVNAFSQIGITKGDRANLLKQTMKDFHEALYWGRPDEALALSTDNGRKELVEQLRSLTGSERIVETKVGIVDISDGGYEANADIITRYYKVPFYVINDRIEREKWRFVIGSGWRLEGRELIKKEPKQSIG